MYVITANLSLNYVTADTYESETTKTVKNGRRSFLKNILTNVKDVILFCTFLTVEEIEKRFCCHLTSNVMT